MRITLNDHIFSAALRLFLIQSVMGHQMGHYVLHHVYKDMLFFFVVIFAGFALLRWARVFWSLNRWGERNGNSRRRRYRGATAGRVAGLYFLFVLTPIFNTQTRTNEHEAPDMYGLNASRQPDGFAQAAIHLGEYRKMSPGPVEEWIFFDHPPAGIAFMTPDAVESRKLEAFQLALEPVRGYFFP